MPDRRIDPNFGSWFVEERISPGSEAIRNEWLVGGIRNEETEVDAGEEQAQGVWIPQRFDLARVVLADHRAREGEIVTVDACGWEQSCRRTGCDACRRVDVYMSRVSPPAVASDWTEDFETLRSHSLEPLRPAPDEQVTVRCQKDNSAHSGQHLHRRTCVSPIRVRDRNRGCMELLSGLNAGLFAAEMAARNDQRQRRTQRASTLRSGETYIIDDSASHLNGFQVRVHRAVLPDGTVPCDIFHADGSLYRTLARVYPLQLGQRLTSWSQRNVPPPFVQLAQVTYAGSAQVTDRDIVDSVDLHDCDHACFEYGCSQPAGIGWSGAPGVVAGAGTSRRVVVLDDEDDYVDHEDCYEGSDCEGCEFCAPSTDINDIPIMPYSYRPRYIFSGDGPTFMGMELELSCGTDMQADERARQAAQTLLTSPIGNLVYLKSDSSISGIGFEAVFHPMSYDWIVENWPVDLLRKMRQDGARPHHTCGMHVHVNRTGFSSASHSYRWIKFMYRNAAQMSRLARRDPSNWGSFRAVRERAAAKWHAKGGYGGEQRYVAINCMPSQTFEVRIFASTLNRTRLLGSLGLVDASVEYTRQLSTQDILKRDGWKFDPFRDFVHSFKKYRPLQIEMKRLLDN